VKDKHFLVDDVTKGGQAGEGEGEGEGEDSKTIQEEKKKRRDE